MWDFLLTIGDKNKMKKVNELLEFKEKYDVLEKNMLVFSEINRLSTQIESIEILLTEKKKEFGEAKNMSIVKFKRMIHDQNEREGSFAFRYRLKTCPFCKSKSFDYDYY